MKNLKVDTERLWTDLMETAKIGGTAKGGICRLTLTEHDRQARDWFRKQAEALGCVVTVDDMGVMFARRPGQRSDLQPIAMGSHLDTQPTGGKFDGVLGVLGALEVLRTLREANYETFAPIEIVNWTNEEGARFMPAMVSSAVFAGAFDPGWVASRKDLQGITFEQALKTIGYCGTEKCGMNHPISAYFELHIEQGPILEMERKEIGIVTGVQGICWFEVIITGSERHAGTTPMLLRRDALLGAARIIELVYSIALAHSPLAVGTVGLIEAKPNSPNVVAGEACLTVDLRHPNSGVLTTMEKMLNADADRIAAELGLEITLTKILNQPPVRFDEGCIEVVRAAADEAGLSALDIVSGAGHDAGYVSRVAPSAMIFVPCRDGVSHNESEFSSKEECAAGAQVLMHAVLAYDQRLANWPSSGFAAHPYRFRKGQKEAS